MKKIQWLVIAAIILTAVSLPKRASALFGLGQKKSAPDATKTNTGLPGMDGTAPAGTAPTGLPTAAPSQNQPSDAASQSQPPQSNTGSAAPSSAANPSGAAQPPAASGGGSTPTGGTNLPTEVVIKGSDAGQKLGSQKPPLHIEVDAFESIRDSLAPDQSLLLAESPYTVTWRHTYPEFLHSSRVIQPWRTTFSERPGIVFNVQEQLQEALGHQIESKEFRGFQWSLTIADEQGRVFQHYEGSKDPPQELVWTGQNDQGEWIKAGRSYSAIYTFTDPNGSPHTKVGKPVQFTGIMHQESDGMHISLDSGVLFGTTKAGQDIEKKGFDLLRAAADLIKRRFNGVPIRVQIFSSTKELAETQATKVQDYIKGELMLMPQSISIDPNHASFSDQRIEILLLNR